MVNRSMKYSDLKPGMQLVASVGFSCMSEGAIVTVAEKRPGEFFIPCDHGQHFLDGQIGWNGELVGLRLADGQAQGA